MPRFWLNLFFIKKRIFSKKLLMKFYSSNLFFIFLKSSETYFDIAAKLSKKIVSSNYDDMWYFLFWVQNRPFFKNYKITKIGKLFFHRFRNIVHLFGPKPQFSHFWSFFFWGDGGGRGVCMSLSLIRKCLILFKIERKTITTIIFKSILNENKIYFLVTNCVDKYKGKDMNIYIYTYIYKYIYLYISIYIHAYIVLKGVQCSETDFLVLGYFFSFWDWLILYTKFLETTVSSTVREPDLETLTSDTR